VVGRRLSRLPCAVGPPYCLEEYTVRAAISTMKYSMNTSLAIRLFLLMLAGHVAHILEEVWGRFWLTQAVYGMGWFLIANWILFCIPVGVLYFVLQGKRWAYSLSIVYASIMILNGIGHNVATIATGRYFDGFAGGYTGIGLVLIGLPMMYALRKEMAASRI
jgi:hypothetical protein